jgi:integrase
MPIHKLSPRQIATIGDGLHGDGGNLYLQVTGNGKGRSWVFLYTSPISGKRRMMGLGSASTTVPDEARARARYWHQMLYEGKDPIHVRDAQKNEHAGLSVTVSEALANYYKLDVEHLKPGTRRGMARFFRRIDATIGSMAVGMVTPDDIVNKTGLADYWPRPSGQHMLMVLRGTFEWAKAKCKLPYNPADRAYVKPLLSKKKHVSTPHASMPFEEVPQFMLELRRYEDRSVRRTGRLPIALALEFQVLTCVRGNEVCAATWKEIDLANRLWNVPPENRKTGHLTNKIRAIPITEPMMRVLDEMRRRNPDATANDPVFPTQDNGKRGYDVGALSSFVRRSLKRDDFVPHGFRNTLTNWAERFDENLLYVDRQFDHLPAGRVAQSYNTMKRPQAADPTLEPRRQMMARWAAYCEQTDPAKVMHMPREAKQETF